MERTAKQLAAMYRDAVREQQALPPDLQWTMGPMIKELAARFRVASEATRLLGKTERA